MSDENKAIQEALALKPLQADDLTGETFPLLSFDTNIIKSSMGTVHRDDDGSLAYLYNYGMKFSHDKWVNQRSACVQKYAEELNKLNLEHRIKFRLGNLVNGLALTDGYMLISYLGRPGYEPANGSHDGELKGL